MGKGKNITKREIEYVKWNIMVKSISEIAEDLGRNYFTIYRIVRSIGITRKHVFTIQEDNFISKYYKVMSVSDIASRLGITPVQVYNRARKLGIKKYITKQ